MKRKQPQPTAKWTVTGNLFAAPTPTRTYTVSTINQIRDAAWKLLTDGFERITIVSVPA